MSGRHGQSGPPTFGDYMRVLRRRAWIVGLSVGISLAVGLVGLLSSKPVYEGTAQVLLNRDSPAATLTGTAGANNKGDPERFIQTQLKVAGDEEVARRVLAALRLHNLNPAELMAASAVDAPPGTDVLRFHVRDRSAALASRLAREYAIQYAEYQHRLDEAALNAALRQVQAKIDTLGREVTAPALHLNTLRAALLAKERDLETLQPLETGLAVVMTGTPPPIKVRPTPKRDTVIALAAGLLIGILLAFGAEALDPRIDSIEGVAAELGIPLLGRIPAELARPTGRGRRHSEAFQVFASNLEASLDVAGFGSHGTAVMVTSATRNDGKTSTVSNLGAALALAGKRVILVDLDGQSSLGGILGVPEGAGVVDVALRTVDLEDALVRLPAETGELSLVRLGSPATELDWLLGTDAIKKVVAELRTRADLVLLDAPPLIDEAGALQIAACVDACFVVLQLRGASVRDLQRVRAALDTRRCVDLGFVVTGLTGRKVEEALLPYMAAMKEESLMREGAAGSRSNSFGDGARP